MFGVAVVTRLDALLVPALCRLRVSTNEELGAASENCVAIDADLVSYLRPDDRNALSDYPGVILGSLLIAVAATISGSTPAQVPTPIAALRTD